MDEAYRLNDARRRKAIIKRFASLMSSESSYNNWCRSQNAFVSSIAEIINSFVAAKYRALQFTSSISLSYLRNAEQSYATSLLRLDRTYRSKYASFIDAQKSQELYNLPSKEDFWQSKMFALKDLYNHNVTTTKVSLINSLSLRVRRGDQNIIYSLTSSIN